MERLTFEGNFCDIAMCCELSCPYNNSCTQREVWERLKQYEGTGLTPEEIVKMGLAYEDNKRYSKRLEGRLKAYEEPRLRELARADKDGRVVVLPCKVGDFVYGFHGEQTILPMVAKWIETNTDGWAVAAQYNPMSPKFYKFSDFGETVFLTREEAEEALRRAENG